MYRCEGRPLLALAFNDKKKCFFLSNVWNHRGYMKYNL